MTYVDRAQCLLTLWHIEARRATVPALGKRDPHPNIRLLGQNKCQYFDRTAPSAGRLLLCVSCHAHRTAKFGLQPSRHRLPVELQCAVRFDPHRQLSAKLSMRRAAPAERLLTTRQRMVQAAAVARLLFQLAARLDWWDIRRERWSLIHRHA
eukprot:7222655-Prymnesium_polylepis.1